jgi:hypothetical protein
MRNILAPLLLLATLTADAQVARQVTGRLVDSTGAALARASVRLYVPGGRDTLRTVTNANGAFLFKDVPSPRFSIVATNIGYTAADRGFSFAASQEDIRLDAIVMQPAVTTLQEVVVTTPPISIKEDTVEYKIDSSMVKPNSMVEDLLKKLPGIEVDKSGNITAQGKSVTRVKVNGKDFFGGDPKAATRELPADIVDKVQVIDDYGDLANISGIKDGEPEKVLNIQIKKERNKGVFGRATGGYGTSDRYQATLNTNIFNGSRQFSVTGNLNNSNASVFNSGGGGGGMDLNAGGVGRAMVAVVGSGGGNFGGRGGGGGFGGGDGGGDGISVTRSLGTNYRHDFGGGKGSFYGSYSYTNRTTDILREVAQQNVFASGNFTNNQRTTSRNLGGNHRAFLNLEYNIDSFNYVKVSPSLTYGNSDSRSISAFDFADAKGLPTSLGSNADTTTGTTPNLSVNAVWNLKFRKRGRNLATNLNLGSSANESEAERVNFTRNLNLPVPVEATLRQLILQDNFSRNTGIRMTFSEPLRPDRFLDLTYAYNRSITHNDREALVYQPTGELLLNPQLSNAFENTFVNQRVGASIRTVKKKYNYALGVNFQPVLLNGYSITKDSSYTPQRRLNAFPVARLAVNFTRTKTLNFNYNGSARQPGFNQLQPVLDNSNPQYQTKGNPFLRPEMNHNLTLFFNNFNFTSGRVLFVGSNLSLTEDKIVNNTIRLGRSGSQLTIPENVDGFYNATGFYNFSKPFQNRRYVISFNGMVNYNHNVNLIDSARNIGRNTIASQGFRFEFNYNDWLEWDAGARYALNAAKYSLPGQNDIDFSSWTLTSNARIDLKGGWILRYDLDYMINYGLSATVNRNVALLNASLEKTMFRKKNGFLRLSGFDILKQATNISRSVNGSSITDTRTNRLTQYFMVTFTYRMNRFNGQAQQQGQDRMRGMEYRMRGGGF